MKKYLVIPGYLRSSTDGQRHWINSAQLIKLYNVNPEECVMLLSSERRPSHYKRHEGLIRLFPRFDGKYNNPDANYAGTRVPK